MGIPHLLFLALCIIKIDVLNSSSQLPRILRSNIPVLEMPERTVGQYIWNKLSQFNDDHVCLIDALTDEHLTIGALKQRTQAVAASLVDRGLTRTDRIAYYGHNSIPHFVLRIAAQLLGLTICPLSSSFEAYEVDQECSSMSVTVVMCSLLDLHKFDRYLTSEQGKSLVKLVVVFNGTHNRHLTYDQLLLEGSGRTLPSIPYFPVDPDSDPYLLIHTSGSTGRPKCVVLKHKSVLHVLKERGHFNYTSNLTSKIHVISIPFPMSHISGSFRMLTNLCLGVPMIIYGGSQYSLDAISKSIEKYRITDLPIYPPFGRLLIEGNLSDKYNLSSLQLVSSCGSKFPYNIALAIIDKYRVHFREVYGMTEYFGITRGTDVTQLYKPGSNGPVSPGTEVKIVDLNTGAILPPNVDGELRVRGIKLFAGYLNNDKAYREAVDSEGWYRTGDIGHYDDRENIYITDRLKEVIKVGVGNQYVTISPVEIEHYLLTHPSIAEAVVVEVNNKTGTHCPRAYVVCKPGQPNVTEQDIKQFVSNNLAHTNQLKGGVVFVDTIKRISIGKIDRKYYRALVSKELLD